LTRQALVEYTSPAKGTNETTLHLGTAKGTALTEASAIVKY